MISSNWWKTIDTLNFALNENFLQISGKIKQCSNTKTKGLCYHSPDSEENIKGFFFKQKENYPRWKLTILEKKDDWKDYICGSIKINVDHI